MFDEFLKLEISFGENDCKCFKYIIYVINDDGRYFSLRMFHDLPIIRSFKQENYLIIENIKRMWR